MTSQAVQLRRLAVFKQVLEKLAEGENVTAACELAGVSPRTFQAWVKSGVFDEYFAEAKRNLQIETLGQIAEAWPKALALLCQDAQDDSLSARDRDQRYRSLLMTIEKIIPDTAKPQRTGESAASFLKRHPEFSKPWQVVVQGDVNISQQQPQQDDKDEDIVEGEIVRHPMLWSQEECSRFDTEWQRQKEAAEVSTD